MYARVEGLERVELPARDVPVLVVVPDEVDEADAVVELEGGISESGGLDFVEFGEHGSHELLVVRRVIGLDGVSHHMHGHVEPPVGLAD
jgi:hypothetical protein